jgi:hypothetical protein
LVLQDVLLAPGWLASAAYLYPNGLVWSWHGKVVGAKSIAEKQWRKLALPLNFEPLSFAVQVIELLAQPVGFVAKAESFKVLPGSKAKARSQNQPDGTNQRPSKECPPVQRTAFGMVHQRGNIAVVRHISLA